MDARKVSKPWPAYDWAVPALASVELMDVSVILEGHAIWSEMWFLSPPAEAVEAVAVEWCLSSGCRYGVDHGQLDCVSGYCESESESESGSRIVGIYLF